MKILSTSFKDLKIIKNNRFNDSRGFFREIFLEKKINKKFPFAYISSSKKNVVRGLHFQHKTPQAKIITVIRGEVFDVALDLRLKSKTFGKIFSTNISENSDFSLYIPEGFAHGFMSKKDNTVMLYQCSNYREKKSEMGIIWNDKVLKINWPLSKKKIISNKDKNNISFKKYIKQYLKKDLSYKSA